MALYCIKSPRKKKNKGKGLRKREIALGKVTNLRRDGKRRERKLKRLWG